MPSPTRPDASLAAKADRMAAEPQSDTPVPTNSPPKPPPETKESVLLRRTAILSFWAVVIFLGLPIWLKTTAVYRAALPLQDMTEWANGQVCKPVFPLRIAIEAPVAEPDAQHLLRTTQHALDDLNEFSAHQLRLLLADPAVTNASQQIISHGASVQSGGDDIALSVRLVPVETGTTPRSHLQPYAPTLDVYYSPAQLLPQASTGSVLASYLAQELHQLFSEEKDQLVHVLSTASNTHASQSSALSPQTSAQLERQSTRALKYAPTYHLTFSLFSPSYAPSSWDVEAALRTYLTPLLESFSAISNFTVDTQVQLYATFSPSVRQPEYDEDLKAWTLRKEDLSGFINAAEWPLSPSIGEGPTVNFILYVPDASQSPLLVKDNAADSWLIPQWGGVHILNLGGESGLPAELSAEMLAPAMHSFSDQLISLFGLPQSPASLPLRISTLERVRVASLIYSASSTLGALAQVYTKLPSIPVPDNVAQSVQLSISRLQQACDLLKDGRFPRALEHARAAEVEAEKAFFERSMVGQVYFPDEHKVAVYLPLLGPIAVPLVMAALKELKLILKRARQSSSTSCSCPRLTSELPKGARGVQSVKAILDQFANDGSPGMVFHAVDKSGNTLVKHAAGNLGVESSEPMDEDNTVFWIASCTKLVTVIAVLQLVEQGKIPLDDAAFVKKVMPEISEKKVFEDGVNGVPQEKEITVRMLLAHTAGFGYGFFDPRVQNGGIEVEGMDGDKDAFLKLNLVNQPGSKWEYGVNVDFAGLILERITGQTLGSYLQSHIFTPLGISTTGASMFPSKETQKHLAHLHQRSTSGTLKERPHIFTPSLSQTTQEQQDKFMQSGGAGLFAKPGEYVKILAALLNDGVSPSTGERILKKETVDLLGENQIPNEPNFARSGPPPANPNLANHAPELYPQPGNPPQGWSFGGFLTIEEGPTGRGRDTMWWLGLPNCFWWVDRARGVAGFLGAQVLPNGDPKLFPAWFMAEKTIYDNLE
ncbi:beta-lactamase/transpeptidase-like protein [Plenodomus tracheiphilus IPT5]|uniref:Beta-lactamase/transpeptidase-like protein n=1 Tax=Plenodomus tracheiphilus IPT5 TaxID=1408161 RepID=A0A6A7BMT7_9PLEO|nr:beta-lactamase/transpeptidase-like protein [Plenodomus tracheiphilus IPT5]